MEGFQRRSILLLGAGPFWLIFSLLCLSSPVLGIGMKLGTLAKFSDRQFSSSYNGPCYPPSKFCGPTQMAYSSTADDGWTWVASSRGLAVFQASDYSVDESFFDWYDTDLGGSNFGYSSSFLSFHQGDDGKEKLFWTYGKRVSSNVKVTDPDENQEAKLVSTSLDSVVAVLGLSGSIQVLLDGGNASSSSVYPRALFWNAQDASAISITPLPLNQQCASLVLRGGAMFRVNELIIGCTGVIYRVQLDGWLPSSSPIAVSVGAGLYHTMKFHTESETLFLGSSVGLGFGVQTASWTITKILFIPSLSGARDPIRAIMLDYDSNLPKTYPRSLVVYWATEGGQLVRTNVLEGATTLPIFDRTSTGSDLGTSLALPITDLMLHPTDDRKLLALAPALVDQNTTSTTTVNARLLVAPRTNCTAYACAECVSDPYCGWCYESAQCTRASACSTDQFATSTSLCPIAGGANVTRGSLSGGTAVAIYASVFLPGQPSFYQCRWSNATNSLDSNALDVTAGSLSCLMPNFGIGVIDDAADMALTLTVRYSAPGGPNGGVNWLPGSPLSFTGYNCRRATAVQCMNLAVSSECGWCFLGPKCVSNANNQCPAIAGLASPSLAWSASTFPTSAETMTPAVVSTRTTSPIRIDVFNFPATDYNNFVQVFQCRYQLSGFSGVVEGTNALATRSTTDPNYFSHFTCPLPVANPVNWKSLPRAVWEVSIRSPGTGEITKRGASLVTVYNCTAETKCDSCTAEILGGGCQWCSTSRSCLFADDTSCPSTTGQCPRINTIEPSSGQLWKARDGLLAVELGGIGLSDTTPVQCHWSDPFDPSNLLLTPPNLLNGTFASCPAPTSVVFDERVWDVTLSSGNVPLMDALPFNLYNCSNLDNCLGCLSESSPECHWCAEVTQVSCMNSTSPTCSKIKSVADVCPVVQEVLPSIILVNDHSLVSISGEALDVNSGTEANLICSFTETSDTGPIYSSSTVAWNSTTMVSCVDVLLTTPGNASGVVIDSETGHLYTDRFNVTVVDCNMIAECDFCVASGCQYCAGSCTSSCDDNSLVQASCPVFHSVEPAYADLTGTAQILIHGSGFLQDAMNEIPVGLKRSILSVSYTCLWGAQTTAAVWVNDGLLYCIPPAATEPRTVALEVQLNGNTYLSAGAFEFFTCPTVVNDGCIETCTASPHCGWCATQGVCSSENQCRPTEVWQGACHVPSLSVDSSALEGGGTLVVTLAEPLAEYVAQADLHCIFGAPSLAREVEFVGFGDNGTVTAIACIIPSSPSPNGLSVPFSIFYLGLRYTVAQPFTWIDCSQFKGCTRCGAQQACGWCRLGNKCTIKSECPTEQWSKTVCPLNALAVGLGTAFGFFALVALVLLLIFLVRRARKQNGLVIAMREPDYDDIAWGSDKEPQYRFPSHRFQVLLQALSRQDHLLQLALSLNCPATEQDSLAKGLVFVACSHGMAPEMIKTVIRAEVRACLEENTLFRSNSVASKMYKFYSRIVGIKYLYHCIARVIMELEVLGRKAALNDGKASEVSILDVTMELDTEKDIGDDVDTDTNLLQLQLICQKILNVLIKKTLNNIPSPLRQIFVEIDQSVTSKFPGSIEAVYKGLGGLFFLRFVCPAITAPHVYGLLTEPPNETTQRQLVLITKVIQSIANMQAPGKKEQYMEVMGSFIETSIPRIKKFYDHLREAANINTHSDVYERVIVVPDDVLLNGLAATQAVLVPAKEKLKSWSSTSFLDATQQDELTDIIGKCMAEDSTVPKKQKSQTANRNTGSKKKKK